MPRSLHLDDLSTLPVVLAPQLAADGTRFACTVKTWDREADKYRLRIWMGSVAEPKSARAVTDEHAGAFGPAFDPKEPVLYFLSSRDEHSAENSKRPKTVNVWALDLRGGEAVRLTRLPGTCSQIRVDAREGRLLFLFQPNDPEPPARAERIAEVLRAAGEAVPEGVRGQTDSPRDAGSARDEDREFVAHRVTRLHWREDGRGLLPKHRSQLWTLDVSALRTTPLWQWAEAHAGDARLRRLTAGPCDVQDPAFSPDGSRIAFISNRSADPDRLSGELDLWVVPAPSGCVQSEDDDWDTVREGVAEPRRLAAPKGPKFALAWSPDGRRIAYLGHTEPLDLWGSTNYHVWSAAADGQGEARDFFPDFDRSASTLVLNDIAEMTVYSPPVWRDGGKEIVFLATDGARVGLYAVASSGGEPRRVHEMEASLSGLAASADGERLAFLASTFTQPADVWTAGSREAPRPLTRLGSDWAKQFALGTPQLVPVSTAEGHAIEAWLLRPMALDPARAYPLILEIHGGPYAAYGDSFVFEFHWLAEQGYCVLFANPRGSQGYGYEFATSIRQDLAAPAHRDLMAAVDLVAARPYVDAERLGVTGGSWGGYMTNWIVSQTNRFRAALAQRSICDFEADFGVSDFGYEVEWMFGGPPWTQREVYERCSPLTYVENVQTPLLLLHSEEDWRCPPAQAELFYGALKMLGREVEMVRFPKESHGLSRGGTPSRRLERLRILAEWFERHLRPDRPHRDLAPGGTAVPAEQPEPEKSPVS